MQSKLQRRVYRRELRDLLGYGDTWFREQQKRGRIKVGHRDPGGKREWFTEAEAQEIVNSLNVEKAGPTEKQRCSELMRREDQTP